MFKRIIAKLSRFVFGDPEAYHRDYGYFCTRCNASKEEIWSQGCGAMEPCQTAPLEFRKRPS